MTNEERNNTISEIQNFLMKATTSLTVSTVTQIANALEGAKFNDPVKNPKPVTPQPKVRGKEK